MNTITLVENGAEVEPLDQTVYPRRRSRPRRPPLPAAPEPTPTPDEKPVAPDRVAKATATVPLVSKQGELDATIPPRKMGVSDPGRGDLVLYLLLFGLVAGAWQISQMKLFKPSGDVGYWLGVAGGSMMLVLFIYPMRKYLRFMQGWGNVKGWFWFHLGLGIVGPWLILVHSQFIIGSLNAGVALYSMTVVVISGVIGRFIYVRVNRGLDGERTSLRALRERAGLVESNARSRLHFARAVEAQLLAFEKREIGTRASWLTHLRQVTLLPLQQWIVYLRCVFALRRPLNALAKKYEWSANDLRRRKRRARRLVDQYLHAVVKVAQYTAYERVFALWHLAHLPFIYLLVISAVVHVIAVHAY